MEKKKIKFILNGSEYTREVLHSQLLTDFLREEMGLTGTKVSCGKGECGACTIIMNDKPVNSCMIFAVQIDGADLLTIEGLEKNGKLTPLQNAFIEEGAVQCGYCIPGMVMSGYALLKNNPKPSVEEIQNAISGNLCRCTGYVKIIKAIQKASEQI